MTPMVTIISHRDQNVEGIDKLDIGNVNEL